METMTLLLITAFAATLCLTLLLAPYLGRMAVERGLVDKPNARKVHQKPMPRVGGVAIFLAFYAALALVAVLFPSLLDKHVIFDQGHLLLILGSLVAFGVGLADDFKGLRARRKLCFQIAAAGLAYLGGIHVETIGFYNLFQVQLGWLSPFVTVFWIVLVINAFNLIDGLDGLAGGVGIIACAFLAYVCLIRDNLVGLVFMTAISGGLLGFLRYNFYPASMFMGDGGSYFLGYLLGTISAYCSMSNSATLTTLIPMLVVALPIIDVTMATLRRFVHGRGIFTPDKQHFHHMLLRLGLSHRSAVIVLYGITLMISCCALIFLRIKDEKAYVVFILLGAIVLYGVAKLGYFKHYDIKAVVPWLNGIGDEVGLSRDRRSFFDIQLKIGASATMHDLGRHMGTAMEMLGFMTCALYLQKAQPRKRRHYTVPLKSGDERRKTPALHATVAMRRKPPDWLWCNPTEELDQHNRSLFRVEMDLQNDDGVTFGTLLLVKNQAVSPVSHYTLKRVEHLKRSVVKALEMMSRQTAKVAVPETVQAPAAVPQFQYAKTQEQVEKLK
jgi:UDP-GlcNAc:undecaprenyl-phosphate GlcNAc-1-phosphate transferase